MNTNTDEKQDTPITEPLQAFAECLNKGSAIAKAAGNEVEISVITPQGDTLKLSSAGYPEPPTPSSHLRGSEADIRKAGLKARDELLERLAYGGTVDNDLTDYMTRIVHACVRDALATEGKADA